MIRKEVLYATLMVVLIGTIAYINRSTNNELDRMRAEMQNLDVRVTAMELDLFYLNARVYANPQVPDNSGLLFQENLLWRENE